MSLLEVLFAWFFADFLSGLGHWWQDRYLHGTSRFRVLNNLHSDNHLHHVHPAAMLHESWIGNVNTTLPLTIPLAVLLAEGGAPVWVTMGVFFAGFANLVHRFAHMRERDLWWPVRFLQCLGLFLPWDDHHVHHYGPWGRIEKKDTVGHYCVMTAYLNPILDSVGFWRKLEWVLRVS